jgi:hypothetical protein
VRRPVRAERSRAIVGFDRPRQQTQATRRSAPERVQTLALAAADEPTSQASVARSLAIGAALLGCGLLAVALLVSSPEATRRPLVLVAERRFPLGAAGLAVGLSLLTGAAIALLLGGG